MREFDLQLWKDRAWARYERAIRSGRHEREVEIEWAHDLLAISDIHVLVQWCDTKGIKVIFVKKSIGKYLSDVKTISISGRLAPKHQAIVLLHECGHHLIGVNQDHDRFGMGYPQFDPEVTKTFHHRAACLEEEMEAWHRGWKLVKRLGLHVDRNNFDTLRLKCIRSYIKWTLKPGTFKPEGEDE